MNLSKREQQLISLLLIMLTLSLAFFLIIGPGLTSIQGKQTLITALEERVNSMEALIAEKPNIERELKSSQETLQLNQDVIVDKTHNNRIHALLDEKAKANKLSMIGMQLVQDEALPDVMYANVLFTGTLNDFQAFIQSINNGDQTMVVTSFEYFADANEFDAKITLYTLPTLETTQP